MKTRLPFILLIFIGLLITFSFYGKVLLHPDSFMFANSGDGLKNYFTYSAFIKQTGTSFNFEGMNYPYGEHFMYTDCHPVLAGLVKILSTPSGFMANHSVGFLNLLMIVSVFLTFIVVFLLLTELDVNRWFGLLFSIGISLLAPQIFRLGGHLALSYSIAIPLSWLLIVKILKNQHWLLTIILLFLNNTFWFFIHAYLGIIITFFLVLILLFHSLPRKKQMNHLRHNLTLLAALLMPVVIFYAFIQLTDSHNGRTDNPSGFFQYIAEADDVFVPNHPPLRPILDTLTGNGIRQQWEAWSYIGLSATLLVLCFVFMGFYRLIKRKKTSIDRFFASRIMNASLLAAFFVLLFAMAVPFRQLPDLVDLIPFIKQFRAIGRFTWPFFFVVTAFSAVVFSKIFEHAKIKKTGMVVVLLAIVAGLANIVEALPYHREMAWTITQSTNLFQRNNLKPTFNSAIDQIKPADYQAIISLPFFYQGSESYSRPRNEQTARASIIFSYHTGIPLVCANLTRTSIRESKNLVQLVSPDYYKKEIEADLPDNRPFLVIRTSDPLTRYEEALFMKCSPVFQENELSLYVLNKADLFSNSAALVYNDFLKKKPQMPEKDNFYVSENAFLYYDGFEQQKSDQPFRGKGGFQSVKKDKNVLAEFGPGTFETGKKYMASAWMFNGRQDALNLYFRFVIEEYNEEADSWESTTYFPDQSEVLRDEWSLVEGIFEVKNPKSRIYIVTIGTKDAKGPLFVDDLLIRGAGLDVYREENNELFFNNQRIPLKQDAAWLSSSLRNQ